MAYFKELSVWQKAISFVVIIYKTTESFPKTETYGLTAQIRRAAVSIPSNIAEGNARRSKLDYLQFLKIARGSCTEIETQLIISKELNYLREDDFLSLQSKIIEISKMINGLIKALNEN